MRAGRHLGDVRHGHALRGQDSSTICARRRVTTGTVPHSAIRNSRAPSSSAISRTCTRWPCLALGFDIVHAKQAQHRGADPGLCGDERDAEPAAH
ncbi:hypothetical protein [Nocardia terpenica]|uniref:hypothetical protein n=1 Tax=Nocardia terpenica TaxID=455432 RepID=UPI00142E841F|nr:hypothetical protein [Nocardia terpenica]